MQESIRDQTEAYVEPPELVDRIDRIGFGMVAGATVTFFLGFVFAYFYLRSLDNNGLWRPAGVSPPDGYGIAITLAFVLCAGFFFYAARAARSGRRWTVVSGIALLLGFAGCVIQAFEYAHLGFGPEDGGFASVFYGWTTLYTVVALVALYRIETIFASGLRYRESEITEPPPDMAPGAYYWALLAAIAVFAWVLLYLV
jgi:heme/copper-type cytochrome/quinol oxidase subunit 3